jgi:transposase-like protein
MEATESIAGSRRTRQYRTTAEKRFVVEATRRPGVSVATVARAHGVNANQVFYWRKLYEAGQLESTTAMSGRDADTGSARLPVTVDEGADGQAVAWIAMWRKYLGAMWGSFRKRTRSYVRAGCRFSNYVANIC